MDGLWTLEFGSSVGVFGGGVVVFDGEKVMGGDAGYFYIGTSKTEGRTFEATITSQPFIEGYESIFKTAGKKLTLKLVGSMTDETHAIAQGYPVEMPQLKIGVKLTKRC